MKVDAASSTGIGSVAPAKLQKQALETGSTPWRSWGCGGAPRVPSLATQKGHFSPHAYGCTSVVHNILFKASTKEGGRKCAPCLPATQPFSISRQRHKAYRPGAWNEDPHDNSPLFSTDNRRYGCLSNLQRCRQLTRIPLQYSISFNRRTKFALMHSCEMIRYSA